MNETYIKIFRKIRDHSVFNDEQALRVFIWILISVDYKTGSMISGRFWASEILGIKPTTYYKILKRLEKKHDLVTLSSNNKNTTILVKNWVKYQSDGNTTGNNKVTTKGQQSNTNQEIKEIKNKRNNTELSEFLDLFNSLFNSKYTQTDGRAKKLSQRLKTYSFEQIKTALENLSTSDWHHGKNDRGWKADPDFLLRTDEQVDKWLNFATTKKAKPQKVFFLQSELDEMNPVERTKAIKAMKGNV